MTLKIFKTKDEKNRWSTGKKLEIVFSNEDELTRRAVEHYEFSDRFQHYQTETITIMTTKIGKPAREQRFQVMSSSGTILHPIQHAI